MPETQELVRMKYRIISMYLGREVESQWFNASAIIGFERKCEKLFNQRRNFRVEFAYCPR